MTRIILLTLPLLTVAACAGSYPAPIQRMADAQSAFRAARELGAEELPVARLHLRLAAEQMARANAILANDEDETRRADFVLIRARADAELALALTREHQSKKAAEAAAEEATEQTESLTTTGARP